MRRIASFVASVVVLVGIASDAHATRVQIANTRTDVIVSEGGEARVLLAFGPLDLPDRRPTWISTAYLDLPLPGREVARSFEVQAFGVPTEWARGAATWTSPWRTPGGDVDGEVPSVELDETSSRAHLRLDVTSLVEASFSEGAREARFLLTVPRGEGEGFSAESRAVLGEMRGATLNLMTVHAGPREAAITPRP